MSNLTLGMFKVKEKQKCTKEYNKKEYGGYNINWCSQMEN